MKRNIAGLLLPAVLAAALFAARGADAAYCASSVHDKPPIDSAQTTTHWNKARAYQAASRFELARQEYLLALSGARSTETVERIKRELQIIDMEIRSLR